MAPLRPRVRDVPQHVRLPGGDPAHKGVRRRVPHPVHPDPRLARLVRRPRAVSAVERRGVVGRSSKSLTLPRIFRAVR